MESTINVGGLECDSCAKVISRLASKTEGCTLKSVDYSLGKIVVDCQDESKLGELKAKLTEAGYAVDGKKTSRSSVGRPMEFFKSVLSGSQEFLAEKTIVESAFASLLVMLVLTAGIQFAIPATKPYFSLLILTSFGTAAFYAALAHHRAFTEPTSCMTGMMVGMTVGMIGGFMFGSLAGAANGMFVGSLAGMAVGMAFGALAGSTVGVMGILEGLMAGLMAGTMGAMLSVMLFSDNVILFLTILFVVCIVILLGLAYLLFRENGTAANQNPQSFLQSVMLNTVFFVLFSALLVWGPRSALSWAAIKGG